ncbi:NAD(P)-binding protein, partial [Mycobacterium gordonae]
MDETEILVIGAGLAGLRCADVLVRAGREVLVWEAK